ncbi:hypothetical protein CYQ85_12075 [Enterococcus faecium]|uniref:hypothetical protein n=1 Tax=Enterococcus faecium TaxID=1352 RepID=UPI0010112756|nr:hypothetical protein [Enterococcus faecium]RXU74502.1 hypothetical protein CYQ85_12075 [Enterococcus faecium]
MEQKERAVSAEKNRVEFGLENVYYAKATLNPETGEITYGTPVHFPGAVELSIEPSGDLIKFNRIRQKSPILYRWVMNAVRYEGYRW